MRKSAGLGRTEPLRGKAIYIAPPSTPQKVRLHTHEALVLHQQTEAFDPTALAPFLGELRHTDNGASRDVKFGSL